MLTEKDTEQLLPEYFRGTLSEEEGKAVDEWICQSASNRRTAQEYSALEMLCTRVEAFDEGGTEAALAKAHSRMRAQRRRSLGATLRNIAAIASAPLLLVCAWLSWQYFRDGSDAMVQLSSASGMTSCTTLPDGSRVWLNSNSSISYPSRFGRTREVTLEGEACFKVSRQAGRKFIVHAMDTEVEVTGTEFDVEAYRSDGGVRTTLLSGSVHFSVPSGDGGRSTITMQPGDRYSWDAGTGRLRHSTVNSASASSWREGRIVLENTSLQEALRQIGHRFNVEFLVRNEALLDQRYTGTFTGQRLEVMLEHFRRTTRIHFDTDIKDADAENVSGRQKIIVY